MKDNKKSQDHKLLYELHKLENRLTRYRHRLLREGFTIADRTGVKFRLVDNKDNSHPDYPFINIRTNKEYSDVRPVLELAKDSLPSLYRRYKEYEKNYISKLESSGMLN